MGLPAASTAPHIYPRHMRKPGSPKTRHWEQPNLFSRWWKKVWKSKRNFFVWSAADENYLYVRHVLEIKVKRLINVSSMLPQFSPYIIGAHNVTEAECTSTSHRIPPTYFTAFIARDSEQSMDDFLNFLHLNHWYGFYGPWRCLCYYRHRFFLWTHGKCLWWRLRCICWELNEAIHHRGDVLKAALRNDY